MRMSCNGCKVLRRGCTNDCTLRPCLQWLKCPRSQANATIFLAKFYGRVGLLNLINAGPPHLRPAIFRSLLYEACGRIVGPIFGCTGLMIAGEWALCEAAVDAVLADGPAALTCNISLAPAALLPLSSHMPPDPPRLGLLDSRPSPDAPSTPVVRDDDDQGGIGLELRLGLGLAADPDRW